MLVSLVSLVAAITVVGATPSWFDPISSAQPAQSVQPATFDRYFVVVFENQDFSSVMEDDYLGKTLVQRGRLLTNYYGVTHPSQPNYIAMTSGSRSGVWTDKVCDIDAMNIVDLLEAGQISWGSYQENYPGFCNLTESSGYYRRKHNPLISYVNVHSNPERCAKIKPASDLWYDIEANAVPQYVFYTPNMNNNGHDTGLQYASNYIKSFFEPLILDNPYFTNTLFLITYDEGSYHKFNKIYSVLFGNGVTPGSTDDTKYNHYSQLATVEARWGLGNLGKGDVRANPFNIA